MSRASLSLVGRPYGASAARLAGRCPQLCCRTGVARGYSAVLQRPVMVQAANPVFSKHSSAPRLQVAAFSTAPMTTLTMEMALCVPAQTVNCAPPNPDAFCARLLSSVQNASLMQLERGLQVRRSSRRRRCCRHCRRHCRRCILFVGCWRHAVAAAGPDPRHVGAAGARAALARHPPRLPRHDHQQHRAAPQLFAACDDDAGAGH